jgi:FMN phosphatase YigB (HAD superfamily)
MFLFLFDLGGTLINDPFTDTLTVLRKSTRPHDVGLPELPEGTFDLFLEEWAKENASYNFPLASHFLQEEIWIIRALGRLSGRDLVRPAEISTAAPLLLARYRLYVKEVVASQKQLPAIRAALKILQDDNLTVGVASNDRQFATQSMLAWSQLDSYFKWIFTSEGLSTPENPIEKPQALFFKSLEEKITRTQGPIQKKIYIGDNERNDVEAPKRLGYITVRFKNSSNPKNTTWLDDRAVTQASYCYSSAEELPDLIRIIIRDLAN